MNQLCKVCGEPAAGFHFGAFTCEGCKSFFGRTYNNISAIAGCKNNGDCVINKKNRTACKACRLRKCLLVGMSKSGSRYGRRSNWFKIHCLLQEQQSQQGVAGGGAAAGGGPNLEQLARLHQMQARQTYQDKTNPCIKSASLSPTLGPHQAEAMAAAAATAQHRLPPYLGATKLLNGAAGDAKPESRLSATPSDSGASSAGDGADPDDCSTTSHRRRDGGGGRDSAVSADAAEDAHERRRKQFLQIFRHHSAEPLKVFAPLGSGAAKSPFAPFAGGALPPPPDLAGTPPSPFLPAFQSHAPRPRLGSGAAERTPELEREAGPDEEQREPIDLSVGGEGRAKPAPLDLTLVRSPPPPLSVPLAGGAGEGKAFSFYAFDR